MSRVYVIDDNPTHAAIAAKVIEKLANAEVEVFNHPFKAMNAVLESPPDLLVVDMMMPQIDGLKLIRLLRRKGVTTRALMLTAFQKSALSRVLPENGIDGVFSKPFDLKQLAEAVRESLTRQTVAQ